MYIQRDRQESCLPSLGKKALLPLLCSYPDSDDMNMDCVAAGDEEANIVTDFTM